MRGRRREEEWVPCWCYGRCARSGYEPKQVTVKTRDAHLQRDRESLASATQAGFTPPDALRRAIELNTVSAGALDSSSDSDFTTDSSMSSNSAAPPPPDMQSPCDLSSGAVEHPYDDAPEEQAPAGWNDDDQEFSQLGGPLLHGTDGPAFPCSSISTEDHSMSASDGGSGWLSAEEDEEQEHDQDFGCFFDPEQHEQRRAGSHRGSDERVQLPRDSTSSSFHAQADLEDLIGDYDPGPQPTAPLGSNSVALLLLGLTPSERATLRHLKTCIEIDATKNAYDAFARNLEAVNQDIKILSHYRAIQLSKKVTGLQEERWDVCVNSCRAFTGNHEDEDVTDCDICHEPRFDAQGKPRQSYVTLPFLPRIRAAFATATASDYLHTCTESAKQTWETDEHRFRDWADGEQHQHLLAHGFFSDPRHDAFMLSLDSTKLVDSKDSDCWVVLLSSMSTPPERRFRRDHTFVVAIIPGPNQPVDIDSFLLPIMAEFARASLGFWIWDGAKGEWFLWKAWLVAVCADQVAAAKVSKTSGASGKTGCRLCIVKANYLPEQKKQVTGYYPLKTVGKALNKKNEGRKDEYSLSDLNDLLRSDQTYADAIAQHNSCTTEDARNKVRRETGVAGKTLLAASPAFHQPFFFPIDIFHLFGINLPSLLWQVLTNGQPEDPFSLDLNQQEAFGELVDRAGVDIPSSFLATPPRNPSIFSESYYKMFEWSAITYHLLLPFLLSIGAPVDVVTMLTHLVQGVRLAVSDSGTSFDEQAVMTRHFFTFARLWEALYIRDQPSLLPRATISVHYLLHVAQCCLQLGSVRICSQARCEREIGLAKRSMRTFKSPAVNVTNNAIQREHLRLLNIIHNAPSVSSASSDAGSNLFQLQIRITSKHRPMHQDDLQQQQDLLQEGVERGLFLQSDIDNIAIRGKLLLPTGEMIRGRRIETKRSRKASRFAWRNPDDNSIAFAEAVHFLTYPSATDDLGDAAIHADTGVVIARPLRLTAVTHGIERGHWETRLIGISFDAIIDVIGILEVAGFCYVLRRLSWLCDE
ncbi:hypothetical protein OC842_004734 [Tilletia horrida]|uniref:Uncharacterized protein n=1 Tax=Tilletia horrida TaxID=155126 RepID=A0AAN6GAI5_9BASI|nr:hypothetical protein OC842_004734 [Tilletia horrida]